MVSRHAAGAALVVGLFAVAAPRVGESDRRESRAIGSLRAIVSAELAYAAAHGGRFATLDCLIDPSCATSDDASAPFLQPGLATTPDQPGYHVELFPNPDPGPDRRGRAALRQFAVIAVPLNGGRGSARAFCADDRQTIYVTAAGVVPRVERGRCLDTTTPL